MPLLKRLSRSTGATVVAAAVLIGLFVLSESASARCYGIAPEQLQLEIERVTVDGVNTADLNPWRTRTAQLLTYERGKVILSAYAPSAMFTVSFSTIIPDGGLSNGGVDGSR